MQPIIQTLQDNLMILTIICGLFGLLLGSFLNVVIFRYPIMLFREWETMAQEILQDRGFKIIAPAKAFDQQPEMFNLVVPRSACPHCEHPISSFENIPVISYLLLRGRCKGCAKPISARYPFIELLTAVSFALVAWHFAFGWQLVVAMLLTGYFIAMSMIDIDHQILPDLMTLPLVWLGLLCAYFSVFISLQDAVIGAIAGYLILWIIYWIFKLLTGKEGMGYGDFKLLAAIGSFVGWQQLPLVIILSAGVGALLGGSLLLLQKKGKETKIPFGPYLAIAGWIALLWGEPILDWYLNYAGL